MFPESIVPSTDGSVGRGRRDMLGMVVSTGVGGGLVLDGRLVNGATGNGGHIGHVVVDPDTGPACECGGKGCLEAIARGPALADWAQQQGWRPGQQGLTAKDLADDSARGHPVGLAIPGRNSPAPTRAGLRRSDLPPAAGSVRSRTQTARGAMRRRSPASRDRPAAEAAPGSRPTALSDPPRAPATRTERGRWCHPLRARPPRASRQICADS